MKESFSEAMRKYKEQKEKEHFGVVLGLGATLIGLIALQAKLIKK